MNKTIGIAILVVAIVGVGIWFATSRPAPATDTSVSGAATNLTELSAVAPSGAGTMTQESQQSDVSPTVGMTKDITVTGQKFSFSPSAITVKKGTVIRLTFKNIDGFHDFKIDEFAVATSQINGGEKATVAFTADKAGSFEYYCSVGNHRTMGMKGTLTVTE